MSDPLLEVRDLRTVFHVLDGAWPAVDCVDLSVSRGEVLGFIGESGSGKSVTGFSLVQLIDPPGEIVAGQITFAGGGFAQSLAGATTQSTRRPHRHDLPGPADDAQPGAQHWRADE
jgi:ABC-type dipeptide/oligopeptide/nickel transport system ATPase component